MIEMEDSFNARKNELIKNGWIQIDDSNEFVKGNRTIFLSLERTGVAGHSGKSGYYFDELKGGNELKRLTDYYQIV